LNPGDACISRLALALYLHSNINEKGTQNRVPFLSEDFVNYLTVSHAVLSAQQVGATQAVVSTTPAVLSVVDGASSAPPLHEANPNAIAATMINFFIG
jgi:hypothetical protein